MPETPVALVSWLPQKSREVMLDKPRSEGTLVRLFCHRPIQVRAWRLVRGAMLVIWLPETSRA